MVFIELKEQLIFKQGNMFKNSGIYLKELEKKVSYK